MKTILALLISCFTCAMFGQAPPIVRNPWSTNAVPTNGIALTPAFYGNVGFGTNARSGLYAMHLRNGTSDQEFVITRELNTYYSVLGFNTGSSIDWQIGQRSGDSYLHLLNAQSGGELAILGNGRVDITSQGSFADNTLNIVNHTPGGYSALAAWSPAGGIGTAAALAIGMGTNVGPYNRAYLGLNPPAGVGRPPGFLIAQEENLSGTYLPRARLHFTEDSHIKFYDYSPTLTTGNVALVVFSNGTVLATGLTVTNQPSNTNTPALKVSAPGVPNALVVNSNGNVGIGTATPTNNLQVVGTIGGTGQHIASFGTNGAGVNVTSNGGLSIGTGATLSYAVVNIVGAAQASVGLYSPTLGSATADTTLMAAGATVATLKATSLNFGIGTATPLYKLHVLGDSYVTNGMVIMAANTVAPSAPLTKGAGLFHDGTNLCEVVMNGAGVFSTNKYTTKAAWP